VSPLHRRSCLQVFNSRRKQGGTPYKKVTTIRFNERELNVPTDNLWLLAIPAAAFVAVSALLGPLVIGIAFSAIAIGAAFTAGTVALAFPFLFLIFFMPLVFGGLSFTGMVTFGVLSIIPKFIALVSTVPPSTTWPFSLPVPNLYPWRCNIALCAPSP
jgi:hypothetical protein